MRIYNLLTEKDLVPKEKYDAIVYYPSPSPQHMPMLENVYYDDQGYFCGTDKEVYEIVDESVIYVLQEYNPERAAEIIKGGYIEDNRFNDLLQERDYQLTEGK